MPPLLDIERDIRHALRFAQSPSKLFALPLIKRAGSLYGLTEPLAILRRLIGEALSPQSDVHQRFHQLILRCDIERSATQKGFADELHVTYRQFHRIRGEAIRTIAAYVSQMPEYGSRPAESQRLKAVAELLAEHDPPAARRLFDLLGGDAPPATQLMRLRARIDSGEEVDEETVASFGALSPATRLALVAQSKLWHGKPLEAQDYLTRIYFNGKSSEIDDTALAELDWLAFLRAKSSCATRELVAIAKSLGRHSSTVPRSTKRALIATATAQLHNGALADADRSITSLEQSSLDGRDTLPLGIAMMLRAQLMTVTQDFEGAMCQAQAARIVLAHDQFAMECQTTYARAALLSETTFDFRAVNDSVTWSKLAYDVSCARAALAEGSKVTAQAMAETALEQAVAFGYHGVAAKAAATLGAALDARRESQAAAQRYLQAMEYFSQTQSYLLAFDLFSSPGMPDRDVGPLALDGELVEFVCSRLFVAVPEARAVDGTTRDAVHAWVRAVLCAASQGEAQEVKAAASAISQCAPSVARAIATNESAVARVLSLAIFPIFRYDRQRIAEERVRSTVAHSAEVLRPPGKNSILS